MSEPYPVARITSRPDGTWTAQVDGASAEIRSGTPPAEIRALAMALLENADYRERFVAREHVR